MPDIFDFEPGQTLVRHFKPPLDRQAQMRLSFTLNRMSNFLGPLVKPVAYLSESYIQALQKADQGDFVELIQFAIS